MFDVRAEKTINMGARLRTRLFLDFFNIANSSASETINEVSGAATSVPRRSWARAPRESDSASSGRTNRRFWGSWVLWFWGSDRT